MIVHKENELMSILERVTTETDEDPNVWKKEEDFYNKHGRF